MREEDDLGGELRLGGGVEGGVNLLEERGVIGFPSIVNDDRREVQVHLVTGGHEVVDGVDAFGDAEVRTSTSLLIRVGMREKRRRVLPWGS